MKRRKFYFVFLIMSLFLLTSCSSKNSKSSNTDYLSPSDLEEQYTELGFNKFDFSATAMDQIEYNNKYFENSKVTMINFWATMCGPCIVEMPEINELASEYNKEDFQVLGVITDTFEGVDTNKDKAKEILDENNITYLNIIPNENLYENYLKNIQAVPTTIFVDSEGNLIGRVIVGARNKEDFKTIVDSLIAN